jgi:predicted Zn-dependent protease with MMP-like domain
MQTEAALSEVRGPGRLPVLSDRRGVRRSPGRAEDRVAQGGTRGARREPRNSRETGAQEVRRKTPPEAHSQTMTRGAFEQCVAEALATIPRRFRDAMSNIAIVVEDEPPDDLLEEMEIEPPDTLFGLYQGTPLTERQWAFGNSLPDRILIFQGPHEREAEDDDDLIVSIGETLIHEIGHYFGMSEAEIEEVEVNYWNRGGR